MTVAISQASHVVTPDNPVPNWGKLVRTNFGSAAWNRRDADEISQTIPHHIVLFSFKPFARRETRLGGTKLRTSSAASGACEIIPAGADYWARWHESKEVAAFSLSQAWLDRLAQSDLDMSGANVFADALPIVDRRVALLAGMLREELRSPSPGMMSDLQLDSLLNLLGIHLLKHYGVARSPKELGGLSDRQFRLIHDYMNGHLSEAMKLDDVAGVVGLSSSQLLRSFRKKTGTSPHQYLTRLRLDLARALIVNEPISLAEIALKCGFSSQSHLTAVMRREDGLTPGALRH